MIYEILFKIGITICILGFITLFTGLFTNNDQTQTIGIKVIVIGVFFGIISAIYVLWFVI